MQHSAASLISMALSCPTGWASSAHGCHRVTTGVSWPHWGCNEMCGPNAALACISSAEENEVVTKLVSAFSSSNISVWLGNYQREGEWQANGWDMCASGETTSFVNWSPSEGPVGVVRSTGSESRCSYLDSAEEGGVLGLWGADRCARPKLHCLCEYGAAPSPEYVAWAGEAQASIRMWSLIIYLVIIPLVSLLPVCIVALCRRCRRPSTRVALYAPNEETVSLSASAVKLADAERAAATLRRRVSDVITALGWAMFVAGMMHHYVCLLQG